MSENQRWSRLKRKRNPMPRFVRDALIEADLMAASSMKHPIWIDSRLEQPASKMKIRVTDGRTEKRRLLSVIHQR